MSWLYEIRDQNGENPVRLDKAFDRRLSIGVNQPGDAEFSLALTDSKATETNLREGRSRLYIYRNGELRFSGPLAIVERYFEKTIQMVKVRSLGWLWFFNKRFVGVDSTLSYTSTDASQIAWGLVDLVQQDTYGNLGITQGSLPTSQDLTVDYDKEDVVSALNNLYKQGGIEFEISPSKVFNTFYPLRGTDRSNSVVFKYPGSIESVRVVSDVTTLVNKEYGLGEGIGGQEVIAERDDVGSQSVYSVQEAIASYKNVANVTTLGNMVEYDIQKLKSPKLTLDLMVHGNQSPSLDDFGIGDSVRIKIDHINYTLNQVFRILQVDVQIDSEDKESLRVIAALL